MGTKKDSNNFNYKHVIKHLKSKGFYIIQKIMGEKEGTIAKRMSCIRFGHKKMDGNCLFLGPGKKHIPELLFYFDTNNEVSFFFNFAVSISGTKRDSFIPFFGEFETSVRENKSEEKLAETLRLFFEKYQDFVDFILKVQYTSLSYFSKSDFIENLTEVRFHKYFVANGKEIDMKQTDTTQFDLDMDILDDNSLFSIYSRFILSNTNAKFFNSKTIFLRDLSSGIIHKSKTRSAIKSVYKSRQFFELCSTVFFETLEEMASKAKDAEYQLIAA